MFFVNQDYLYGNDKFYTDKGDSHGSVNRMNPQASAERSQSNSTSDGMETAVKAAKAFVGAHVTAAKFAGGAVSKLSKNAVNYAKSDDAKAKMNAAKNKAQALASEAGSAVTGLKNRASAFAEERKKASDENIPASDEYDLEENYNARSDEMAYQGDEEYEYVSPDISAEPGDEAENFAYEEETSDLSPESADEYIYEEETPEYVPKMPAYKPDTPQYSNPGYIIQERKTSPVLIIVIIALVLIIGILGGMLFMSSRNKKESDSRKNSIGSDVEISENEAIETTMKTTKKPTTETTTTATTTEKATETTTAPQHVDTMDAAKKAINTHLDEQFQMEQNNGDYFDRDAKYAMYDVNGDGIDELFISYLNFESTGSDLYIYNNGEYVKSHEFYTGADICLSEHLLCEKVYGGGEMTKIYVISDDSILQKDEIKKLSDNFYHNDFVISEQEYNSLLSKYEALDWIHVPDNSDYISNLIDMSAYTQQPTDPYADIKQGQHRTTCIKSNKNRKTTS